MSVMKVFGDGKEGIQLLYSVENNLDKIVYGVLVGGVHLLSIAVGYYHTTCHGTMSEDGRKTGKS